MRLHVLVFMLVLIVGYSGGFTKALKEYKHKPQAPTVPKFKPCPWDKFRDMPINGQPPGRKQLSSSHQSYGGYEESVPPGPKSNREQNDNAHSSLLGSLAITARKAATKMKIPAPQHNFKDMTLSVLTQNEKPLPFSRQNDMRRHHHISQELPSTFLKPHVPFELLPSLEDMKKRVSDIYPHVFQGSLFWEKDGDSFKQTVNEKVEPTEGQTIDFKRSFKPGKKKLKEKSNNSFKMKQGKSSTMDQTSKIINSANDASKKKVGDYAPQTVHPRIRRYVPSTMQEEEPLSSTKVFKGKKGQSEEKTNLKLSATDNQKRPRPFSDIRNQPYPYSPKIQKKSLNGAPKDLFLADKVSVDGMKENLISDVDPIAFPSTFPTASPSTLIDTLKALLKNSGITSQTETKRYLEDQTAVHSFDKPKTLLQSLNVSQNKVKYRNTKGQVGNQPGVHDFINADSPLRRSTFTIDKLQQTSTDPFAFDQKLTSSKESILYGSTQPFRQPTEPIAQAQMTNTEPSDPLDQNLDMRSSRFVGIVGRILCSACKKDEKTDFCITCVTNQSGGRRVLRQFLEMAQRAKELDTVRF